MPQPALRRLLGSKTVPLVWCIVIPILLTGGGIWLIGWFYISNSVSNIASTVIPDRGTFSLGQNSDAEFGYKLWTKVGDSEWEDIGWSLNGGEDAITATSPDGRFHGILAEGVFNNHRYDSEDHPIMVILDSTTGIIWPAERSQEMPFSFWIEAWKAIKQAEPRFPKP